MASENTWLFEAKGYSMRPFLRSGQRLIIKKLPIEDVEPGNIILYRANDLLVCHRLIKKVKAGNGWILYTRADNRWLFGRLEAITGDNYEGTVAGVLKNDKTINLMNKAHFLMDKIIVSFGPAISCFYRLSQYCAQSAKPAIPYFAGAFVIYIAFCELVNVKVHILISAALLAPLVLSSLFKARFNLKQYFLGEQTAFFWTYLAAISFSVWLSLDRTSSLDFYKPYVLASAAVFFAFKNFSKKNLSKILYAHFLCAVFVSAFGLAEMLSGTNFLYTRFTYNIFYEDFIVWQRMMSTLIHPNILGSYLITVIPLGFYFCKASHNKTIRALNFLFLLVTVSALILTFSRGTLFALLLMISLWLIWVKKARWVIYVWLLGFSLCLFAGSPSFKNPAVKTRFSLTSLTRYTRFGLRINAYKVTGRMLESRPLFGIGLNQFRARFDDYSSRKYPYLAMVPNSIYLMHLSETGIIGFAGFALFLLSLIIGYFKKKPWKEQGLIFFMFLGFLGLLFNMAFYDGLLWRSTSYLFWLYAGLGAGFLEKMKQE